MSVHPQSKLEPEWQAHLEEYAMRLAYKILADVVLRSRTDQLQSPKFIGAQIKRRRRAAKLQKLGLPEVKP